MTPRKELPLLDMLPDPALVVDAATRLVVLANDAACRWTGRSMEELLDLPVDRLADRIELPEIDAATAESGEQEKAANGNGAPAPRSSVTVRPISIDDRPHLLLMDSAGRYPQLRVDSVKAASAGPDFDDDARLRQLFDHTSDLIYTRDMEGNITSINQAGLRMFGYEPDEATSLRLDDLVDPKSLAEVHQVFGEYLNPNKPTPMFEIMCRRKDGSPLWLEASSIVLEKDGKPVGIQGIGRDITEHKLAQEALRESQRRLEEQKTILTRVVEQNPYAIAFWNPDGEFESCNAAYVRLIGVQPPEWYNILKDRQAREAGTKAAFEQALMGETVFVERVDFDISLSPLMKGSPSKPVTFSVTIFPILDSQGEVTNIVTIFQDLERQLLDEAVREKLEAQLRQAQKMEAIGTLAGGVAHDFNNLLTGVVGYLDMIRTLTDKKVHPYVTKAEMAAQRASELTRQLLAYARKSRIELCAHDMNSTADEVQALLGQTIDRRITVVVTPSAQPATVRADPGQMSQVVLNLCINARDAIKDRLDAGGYDAEVQPRIEIRNRRIEIDADYVRSHSYSRVGTFNRLSVIDNGTGMDEETRQRIFDPFFTTKPVGTGTGLGLATIFGIVKQHEGWVEVYSELGVGSVFHIYLPAVDSEPSPLSDAGTSVRVSGGSETILLVDDEDMIRELAKDLLESKGYSVILACDGQDAIEIFERRKDEIDLVVLDLTMPRLSGHEVLPRLLSMKPGLRVIVSSGYSSDDETRQLMSLGAAAFVEKPYNSIELQRSVRSALDSGTGQPPRRAKS